MNRNTLSLASASAALRSDGTPANATCAAYACRFMRRCSSNLATMMYQLPSDMMTRIASVILATRSPPFHIASSPYGLSTISVAFALAAALVGAATGGVGIALPAAGAGATEAPEAFGAVGRDEDLVLGGPEGGAD